MLNKELQNQLIKLHKECFNDGDYAEFFFEHRMPSCKAYVIEENGMALSACYARFFTLVLEGKTMTIPFLTGVATDPSHRYQGLARKVVEKAKHELANEGYPFAILHPFNHDFYRKLGFETINYKTNFMPSDTPLSGVEFKLFGIADLPLVAELYNNIVGQSSSYKIRDLDEFRLLIGNSLKHGGLGYIIYQNGIPKGYIWCEDGACQEAVVERTELLNGFPLRTDYTLTIMGGNTDYSMGTILGLQSLLQSIPYCKEASGKVDFTFKGINYQLIVENGCFLSLTETDSRNLELNERELIAICLGQGDKVKANPFKNIIPMYNLVCYEIY